MEMQKKTKEITLPVSGIVVHVFEQLTRKELRRQQQIQGQIGMKMKAKEQTLDPNNVNQIVENMDMQKLNDEDWGILVEAGIMIYLDSYTKDGITTKFNNDKERLDFIDNLLGKDYNFLSAEITKIETVENEEVKKK